MDVSVLILSRGRSRALSACLSTLAAQTVSSDRFEVLVGVDTGSGDASDSMPVVPEGLNAKVTTILGETPGVARNDLLGSARGRWVILLKDDVLCHPRLLEQHIEEHAVLSRRNRSALIVGSAPWRVIQPDKLFNRVLRHSSMAFSYDRMNTDREDRDWGYRHAWALNLSVPRMLALEGGGFDEELDAPMYLDLEWARRMWLRRGTPVLYRPTAVVTHDHEMTPQSYLRREFRLGQHAHALARHDPECAQEIFNTDILCEREIEHVRWQLFRDSEMLARLRRSFESWAALPANAIDGPQSRVMMQTLYEQQLPLRRSCWQAGILFAADVIDTGAMEDLEMPHLLAA